MTNPTTSSSSNPTAADVLSALDRLSVRADACLRVLAAEPQATAHHTNPRRHP